MMAKDGTAKSTGLLNGLFPRESIILNVSVSDVDIYLYAADQQIIGGEDIEDESQLKTTVFVHVSLVIPAKFTPPERIESLTIEFKSEETLGFPSGIYERNNPHQIIQKVDSATGLQLQRGKEYTWDVPLQINALTAPYERGAFGRLFHKITATVEWPGLNGWFKAGKTLVAERPVFLASVPQSTHVLNYHHTHNGYSETLGPVILHTRTRQLSVGGYLRVALSLPRLTPRLDLQKLVLTLIQNTTLVSRKDPNHSEQCQPERRIFFEKNKEALQKELKKASRDIDTDSLDVHWIARLPDDHQARPSTLFGNQAAIRHDHLLEMTLTYKGIGAEEVTNYIANWPLLLPNCSLTLHRIKLPSYSQHDPNPVPLQNRDDWEPDKYANIHMSQTTCACGQTLEKLLSWEDEGDDEDRTCTTHMAREAVRSASSSMELERRARSRGRSRSRHSSHLLRDASARPSLNNSPVDTGDEEEMDTVEEAERRLRQKVAQQYQPVVEF